MSLFDAFSTGPADAARNTIQGAVQQGFNLATPQYQTGIGQLQQYGGQALAPLQQNLATANTGTQGLLNLLGLGGAAGSQGALQALQATPGYQFQLQQGNNAITAQNAATGGTGSGNEALALAKFNQGLAGTTYQNAVQNLQPFVNLAQNTAGQAATTNLGIGGGLNSAYQNLGNMYYGGTLTGGQAGAAADLARYQASANQLGALGGLAGGLLGFVSDIKVKEDIAPVGTLADGQTIYRYRYAGDPRHQIGLLAQEVEGSTPEAVFDAAPDLKGVDYRRATERAAKILEFSRARYEPPPTHRPFAAELMEFAA